MNAGVAEVLRLLETWTSSAQSVVDHMRDCPTCRMAEVLGGKGYCPLCERLWQEELRLERLIQEAEPQLRELGIDAQEIFRDQRWRYWKEPQ